MGREPPNELKARLLIDKPTIKVLEVRVGKSPFAVGIGTPQGAQTETKAGLEIGQSGGGVGASRDVSVQGMEWNFKYWRDAMPKWVNEKDLDQFLTFTASTTTGSAAIFASNEPLEKTEKTTTMDSSSYTAIVYQSGRVDVQPRKNEQDLPREPPAAT